MAKHASLAPVHGLIDGIVRIVDALDSRKPIVEICFLDPLAVAVDIMETTITVDGDEIRCNSYVCAVLFVQPMEPEVSVSFEAVVKLDPWCQ